STHDTKRGEDVRARIDVLSEIPDAWRGAFTRWAGMNAAHRRADHGEPVPDANDEYLLSQTLVGAWPLEGEPDDAFAARIQQYMEKATREAKVHTSWINPNHAYDDGVRGLVAGILAGRAARTD